MSEVNKAVVRSAYAAIDAGAFVALAAVIAEDVVEYDVVPAIPPTKADVIQFFTGMRKSFSGLTLAVHDMIAEGDKGCHDRNHERHQRRRIHGNARHR